MRKIIEKELIEKELITEKISRVSNISRGIITGKVIAGNSVLGEAISGKVITGNSVSWEAISGRVISGKAVPGKVISGKSISGKVIALLMAVLIAVMGLCSCGSSSGDQNSTDQTAGNQADSGQLRVVTTIFPIYDWTKSIAGTDNSAADVYMLINKGVDLHSYQPSAEDIMRISECDVFIYVGGESDEWAEDALNEAVNENMVVVNLMEALGDRAREEELVEGMQESEEEGEAAEAGESGKTEEAGDSAESGESGKAGKADDDEDVEEASEEEPEYDEHIWLSLNNASLLADTIAGALAKADGSNAEVYSANAAAYKEKLDALDAEYEAAVSEASVKTLLFGDRFPFRYMTDDYGLDYYAAFIGCSAETEASFETIAFLSGKVDELGLKNIMTIEGQDHSIAESIRDNTAGKDQNILTMDSMQSMTSEDVEKGTTYLSVMEENLEVLREALSN